MLSSTRARIYRKAVLSPNSISIPSFLLPAFQSVPSRSFSATFPHESQIGKAPLSIPPEVTFTVIPPQLPKNGRHSAVSARSTVAIEGPRGTFATSLFLYPCVNFVAGKLTMTIPPFVNLEHDEAARKAVVSVNDREERKQREMWGKDC